VFQYTPIGHLGGLNFANLGTCGHSFFGITPQNVRSRKEE